MTGYRVFGVERVLKVSKRHVTFAAGLSVPEWVDLTMRRFLGYDVRLRVAFRAGRFECSELTVSQRPAGPAVTGDALRDVTVMQMVRVAIRLAVVQEMEPTLAGLNELLQAPEGLAAQGPTEETLRWVAQAYEVAYALNEPPTKSVQTALGVSRATAGRWVAEARRRSLLPPVAEGEGVDG